LFADVHACMDNIKVSFVALMLCIGKPHH